MNIKRLMFHTNLNTKRKSVKVIIVLLWNSYVTFDSDYNGICGNFLFVLTKSKQSIVLNSLASNSHPFVFRWVKFFLFINIIRADCTKSIRKIQAELALIAGQFGADHLLELRQDLVLALLPFLLAEHCKGPFLIRRVDLVFLTDTHCLHAAMSGREDEDGLDVKGVEKWWRSNNWHCYEKKSETTSS